MDLFPHGTIEILLGTIVGILAFFGKRFFDEFDQHKKIAQEALTLVTSLNENIRSLTKATDERHTEHSAQIIKLSSVQEIVAKKLMRVETKLGLAPIAEDHFGP